MSKEDDDEEPGNLGVGRYPCMPSLVALQQMRNRLHLAHLGKKLMKWSALATGRELRKIAAHLNDTVGDLTDDLSNAYMLVARARYYNPNLNQMVLEHVGKEASLSLTTTPKTVSAGVKVFQFEISSNEKDPYPHLGIEKGGQSIKEAKSAWYDLLTRMILILELRESFSSVEGAHKSATKKANVLKKIIIPKTTATIQYIQLELEELSREELFRIKKVVQYKKKKTDALKQINKENKENQLPSSSAKYTKPHAKETAKVVK